MGQEQERDGAVVQRLAPLDALFDEASGEPLPLPPELLAFYGPLRMTSRADRPHVFANFVASVDGIVAVDPPRGKGAAISGGNAQDRAVMGLLRAVADAVVIGAGNLRAEGDHLWTAERICPELTRPYAELRAALGKCPAPLQIIVSATGDVDLSRAVFSGAAPSVVVTSAAGATRLRSQHPRRIAVHEPGNGWIPLAAVLELANVGPGALVLVESGPTSTTRYLAEGAVDEIFLTIAPIFVGGRAGAPPTLALLEREFFPPGTLRGQLLSARRAGSFLLLRYGLG